MSRRRVVITGMGTVNPLGHSVREFWAGCLAGKNGIRRIETFDVSEQRAKIAGTVEGFDPWKRLEQKVFRKHDRYTLLGAYAADEALEDAGLKEGDYDPFRSGAIVGSGIGGITTLVREAIVLHEKGPLRVSPYLVPMMIPDIATGVIAMEYNLRGPNFCVTSACATASHSIGESLLHIRNGAADLMVTGGAEAPVHPLSLAGFANMRALSTWNDRPEAASRPFDAERNGFVMGEGAGIVVLEELEHAKARGARIYCELLGYGATADAHHITAPDPSGEGAYGCMAGALRDGGVSPEEVGYINAHGTSTKLNDATETMAIKRLFGKGAYELPVSSTKSMVGHLLGAAGGVELIATVMGLYDKKAHPTRNYETEDPECDLDYIPEGHREIRAEKALSNSFGFGGHNASLLVGAA